MCLSITLIARYCPFRKASSIRLYKSAGMVIVIWAIFVLVLPCCAQESAPLGRPAGEFEAVSKCDRIVFGEQNAEKRTKSEYVYDTLYKRWLLAENRADEMTRCLAERHGWSASLLPDGRRAAKAPD